MSIFNEVFKELKELDKEFQKELKIYFEPKNKLEKMKKKGQELIKEANFCFDVKDYRQEDFVEKDELDFLDSF